ncbi:MAG: dihydrofolate reductase family protein, partial [Planctomycetes bacterium]|nr:dihydrofolate reductase family protein [Planctomycetota bacterium]
LEELGRREWTRLLVEGGSAVLGSFMHAGLADELRVFLAAKILGGRQGIPCVDLGEIDRVDQAFCLPAPSVEDIDGDLLLTYRLRGK